MVEPNTDTWYAERLGRFTGSSFHRLMAYPDKKKLAAGAQTYVLDCVSEELVSDGSAFEGNASTEWGHTYEMHAIREYEIQTGVSVTPGELVVYNDHISCTPDGFIGKYSLNEKDKVVNSPNGIVEVKCPPKKSNHIKYLMVESGADLLKTEKQYYWQCQGNMMVTGATYCMFITYHPHYSGILKMGFARIDRNEKAIKQLRSKLALAILKKREVYRRLGISL